jgi:hypothetical protein
MIWKKNIVINGIYDCVYYDYRNIIEKGYFIYYDENNVLHIISTNSLIEVYTKKTVESGEFIVCQDSIYFEEAKSIFRLAIPGFQEEKMCNTELERIHPLNEQFCIGTEFFEKDNSSAELINIRNNTSLWKRNRPIKFSDFINGVLLFDNFNRTLLVRIDLITGEEIWRKEIMQESFWHKQRPLLSNNILIVPHSETRLMGLNVNTGQTLWEAENCFFSYQLDPNTSLLYSIDKQTYQVIDPVNGKKLVEKTISELENDVWKGANSKLCTIHEGAFYFTNNNSGIQVGKINIETSELEYYETIDTKKVENVYAPNFYNKKMFVMDSDNVMHIFEAQDGMSETK